MKSGVISDLKKYWIVNGFSCKINTDNLGQLTTATDVGSKGVDDETGHDLINCYRAVKEVIRRRDRRKN